MKNKIKKSAITILLMIFSFTLSGGFNFAAADEIASIKIDGDMSEWRDVPTLLTRTMHENPPFKGTTYYWNNETDSWQTEAIDNACFYNETTSLDLGRIKFANDADNLYFAWTKRGDYYDIYWLSKYNGADYLNIGAIMDGPITTADPVNKEINPPCLGEYLNLPINYNHDMVFAFDTNLDLKNDYYLVMNFYSPILAPGEYPISTVTSYIYQDNSDGVYNKDEETLLTDLGSDFEIMASVVPVYSGDVHQEGRVKINTLFTDLGIKWGSTVLVNYEAHSPSKLFSSAKTVYSFNKSNKLGLKILSPKTKKERTVKKTQKTINIKASVKRESKISIYVNRKKVARFTVKGKFSKKIQLKKGVNVVIIKAKRDKGLVKKSMLITRKKR